MYDSSLKAKWDYENSIAYAEEKAEETGIEKGIEKGIEQGIEKNTRETALKMIKSGLDIKLIANITGLSVEEIEKL